MTAAAGQASLVCVTGRFQPVHDDHLRLMRTAREHGDRLVVAVTNPDPGSRSEEPASEHRHRADANPFTYYERVELLTAAIGADPALGPDRADVRIVPFDLSRPESWPHYVPLRAVQHVGAHGPWEQEKVRRLAAGGYPVVQVPAQDGLRRTSTAIRAALRAGQGWEPLVPPATVPLLQALLAGRRAGGGAL